MNNLFYTTKVTDNLVHLEEQEAVHCSLVLRKKVGDIIYVIDGKGSRYKCGIDTVSKKEVQCTILSTEYKEQSEYVTIAIAPTKNRDRLEWMIEKLVEIGVKSIVLMNTTNTERTRTNFDRLLKKTISATKQSLRFYIPTVQEMSFKHILELESDMKFIAHCYDEDEKDKHQKIDSSNVLVLIGPEGDFTKEEVQDALEAGFKGLDLGEYRLRTETAAIVAAVIFQ